MKTHPFAEFIYSVEDTLGLWHKARKTEQASKHHYDEHCEHFQNTGPSKTDKDNYLPRLEEIFKRLHVGCNLPTNMMDNHVDILENIYIYLARQTNIMEVFSDNPIRYYLESTLIPLICADICLFKEDADERSIYFHLDRILKMKGLVKTKDDKYRLDKRTAKKYINEYIENYINERLKKNKDLTTKNIKHLISGILDYVKELPKKGNQTCVTINQILSICNNNLSREKVDTTAFNMQSIAAAYTAIIILQDIDKKTNMFNHFYHTYNSFVRGDDDILNNLLFSMYSALNDNYRDIEISELFVSVHYSYAPKKILSNKKYLNIKKIIEYIFELLGVSLISTSEKAMQVLTPLLEQELYLSKMVSIPPQFDIPMVISDKNAYSAYAAKANTMNIVIFDKNNVSNITALTNKDVDRDEAFYTQYIPLVEILDCIKHNNENSALNIIKNIDKNTFSLFGFIKYAIAVLHIGLMYRFKKNNIKHLSLMRQVNDIINHQGMVAIPVIIPSHVTTLSNISWLSDDEYLMHSIINGGNTYNAIILQAIYSYNFTVARHTSMHNVQNDATASNNLRINLLDINYTSSLINHNLLERLNTISGKILSGLNKVRINEENNDFINDLISKSIILPEDLTDNLLHCIAGSTLSICLLDHLSIIMFLSVPGDDVENIIELGKNKTVVELLFRYHHPKKK